MAESAVGEFWPKDIAWWLAVTQDWKVEWLGPVDLVLCKLWREGFQVPNDDVRLANAARVSLRAWKAIRKAVGDFFTVRDGFFTQPTLEALHASKLARGVRFKTRNRDNVNKRWAKEREKRAAASNGYTNGNTNGIAIGFSNGNTKSVPLVGDRASSSLDLRSSGSEEEDPSATRVPIAPHDERVQRFLEAYPKVRYLEDGRTSMVHIGTSAAQDVADFLTQNPDYPLVFVGQWYAKNEKFPKNLRNFLDDPPGRALWGRAWDTIRREGVARLRGMVDEIQDRAKEARAA